MENIQLTDLQMAILIAVAAAFVMFILQLVFCFKAKNRLVKIIPLFLSGLIGIVFFMAMKSTFGWDTLELFVLDLYELIFMGACLLAFLVYGINKQR